MTQTAWKMAQAQSLRSAENWGEGWTGSDLELVSQTMDIPVAEVAATVGRTLYAVSTVRGLLLEGKQVGSNRKAKRQEVGYDYVTTFPPGYFD